MIYAGGFGLGDFGGLRTFFNIMLFEGTRVMFCGMTFFICCVFICGMDRKFLVLFVFVSIE